MLTTRSFAVAAWSAVAVAAGLLGYLSLSHRDKFSKCRTSIVAGPDTIGGAFTLVDQDGYTVTDRDVLKSPSLVYFGYTYCPDICPTDMARNAEAVDDLDTLGYKVTPVFISVDPNRDTPEVLRQWTQYLHPRMIGLTGTPAQIDSVTKAYRTIYQTPADTAGGDYLVDHMTQTYLMLPGYGFADFFSRDQSASSVAGTAACFLKAAG